MKKIYSLMILVLALSAAAFAQDSTPMTPSKAEKMEMAAPTDKDKTEAIPAGGVLRRGAPLGGSKKVALADVLKDPNKYAGKSVRVKGVIVRSCKMEGCWMELAPAADAKSVRVKMKDHAFFIPLDAAGALAEAEGVFSVKTLSKAEVDHMVNDDGAKFGSRNADGSVTEVSFEAAGVELTKATR